MHSFPIVKIFLLTEPAGEIRMVEINRGSTHGILIV